jgi:hypothetical protein
MDTLKQFPQIALRIISAQELVIGPLAWDEARKVQGLNVLDEKKGEVSLKDGDQKNIINQLVNQYEKIFGKASHAVCREAVQDLIAEMSTDEVPSSLK